MTDTIATGGILVDKAVAAIAPIADSPKSGRPVLSCIHIRNGSAYAADGFRAMAVDLPVESVDADAPLNIPAKSLADAVKSLGRNSERRTVEIVQDGDAVTLATGLATFGADTVDGTYPDIESVFPRSEPVASISVNATLLSDVLDAMSKAGVGQNLVTLHIHGERGHDNGRIVVSGYVCDTPDCERAIRAVVMPMVVNR